MFAASSVKATTFFPRGGRHYPCLPTQALPSPLLRFVCRSSIVSTWALTMASLDPHHGNNLYPQVISSNPDAQAPASWVSRSDLNSSNLYPAIDVRDLTENLFPENSDCRNPYLVPPSAPPVAVEEVLVKIPGAILNIIDRHYSVELACGDFSIVRLRQGENVVAMLVRVGDEIQWPLIKDEAVVKLDESHYFFSLRAPRKEDSDSESSDEEEGRRNDHGSESLLNYGLTIPSKGKEKSLKELDRILDQFSSFTVQKVSYKAKKGEALDASLAEEKSPADLKPGKKKKLMEGKCAAYWTTLAPNVEDYSGTAAKLIAAGSGHVIKGILWSGDVTAERLKWGNDVMKKKMSHSSEVEIDPRTLKKIKRVKRVTKMTQKVANGVLSGVIKVSGYLTSSLANSKVGKKFFGLLPGEILLASLDGFSRVCDASEVAGKNVMSTSATVTTDFVSHRYGEEASRATGEGLDAAGHAIGTAWAAFKIRKALNPKSVLKTSSLAKSAVKAGVADMKAKKSK